MMTTIRFRWGQLKNIYQDPTALRGRLLRGVTWSLVGVAIVQALKLLTSIILARILGDVGFGELGIINSTVVTFGIFAGLGLGITATKYVAQLRNQDTSRAGQIIGFLVKLAAITGMIMTLVVILFAPLIADRILNAPHLTEELRIGSVLLLLNALNGVQIGALAGLESFQAIALLSIFEGMTYFLLVSIGAWFWGLSGAISAYVLVAFIKWSISQWALRKTCLKYRIDVSYRKGAADWQILWTFALPALLVSLSSQPFSWLTRVILANEANGYAELGVFNAAFTWTTLLLFLPRQISQPSMPILSNLYSEHQIGNFLKLIRVNLLLVFGASSMVAIPLILLSTKIMKAYGDDFVSGSSALIIVLLAYVIASGTLVFRNLLMATNRTWWLVLFAFVSGLVLVGVLVFLGPNALNLAIAYLLSFTILLFSQVVFFLVSLRIYKGGHEKESYIS